ncbi:MAG: hypothetical protein K2M83_13725 [Muribaculaceae bacterium]|nr:hypothetical protein [Muribaculaceae bacterium]
MNPKSFLFVGSWIQPLKALPLKQRWNVMEAIVEYSISGKVPESPDVMEALAFGFIRNEIDRMRYHRKEAYRKRPAAANDLQDNEQPTDMQTETATVHEDSDAKACKAMHTDAPYDIESVSKSESKSKSKSESDKKSSTTSSGVRVCVKGGTITTISDTAKMNERIQHGIRIRPRALSGYDYLTLALMGGDGNLLKNSE